MKCKDKKSTTKLKVNTSHEEKNIFIYSLVICCFRKQKTIKGQNILKYKIQKIDI